MDRLDGEFAIYWNELRAELATHLPKLTLSLFRDLSSVQATAIARLIANGKKLRAGLLVTVCEALGGTIARALPSAAAIECARSVPFTMIWLTVIDAPRSASHPVHGSRRAVLLADVMFATALQRSAELESRRYYSVARSRCSP